jgi:hypothetical protein
MNIFNKLSITIIFSIGIINKTYADNGFTISLPENGAIFYITEQSQMPVLTFLVTSSYPQAPVAWSLNINYHWRRGNTATDLPATITYSNDYTPDFSSFEPQGGNLTVTAIYNPSENNTPSAIGNYKIYGTNPGRRIIAQEAIDPLQTKIACVESSFRQFEAASENGQGLPLIGKNDAGEKIGGVGIMQVLHQPIIPGTVWNWRNNLNDGLTVLNEKRSQAKRLHINERIRLNADRKNLGLPSCPPNIPTPLTSEQITRDSIRRYNYGVEYRWEPRDSVDCAGQWIEEPSCVRQPRNGCDQDYVNKVLACTENKETFNENS